MKQNIESSLDESAYYQGSFGSPSIAAVEECFRRQLPVSICLHDHKMGHTYQKCSGKIKSITYSLHGKTIEISLGLSSINLDQISMYSFPKPLENPKNLLLDSIMQEECSSQINNLTNWIWKETNFEYLSEPNLFLETNFREYLLEEDIIEYARNRFFYMRKVLALLEKQNIIVARAIQDKGNWVVMIRDPQKLLKLDPEMVGEEVRKIDRSWLSLNEILEEDNPGLEQVVMKWKKDLLTVLQAIGCLSIKSSLIENGFEITEYDDEKIQRLRDYQITAQQLLAWNGEEKLHPEVQNLIDSAGPVFSAEEIANFCLKYSKQKSRTEKTVSLARAEIAHEKAIEKKLKEGRLNRLFLGLNCFINDDATYKITFLKQGNDWEEKLFALLQSKCSLIEKRYAIRNYLEVIENGNDIFYKVLTNQIQDEETVSIASLSSQKDLIPVHKVSSTFRFKISEALTELDLYQKKLTESSHPLTQEKALALRTLFEVISKAWVDLDLLAINKSLEIAQEKKIFALHQNPRWDKFWRKEQTHAESILSSLQRIVGEALKLESDDDSLESDSSDSDSDFFSVRPRF